MKVFTNFLNTIQNLEERKKIEDILVWVNNEFPDLVPEIKYNQPMFTNHGIFIIAFSISQDHLSVAPEKKVIDKFSDKIIKSGYEYSTNLLKILWKDNINYELLREMIEFNLLDKKSCLTFSRS